MYRNVLISLAFCGPVQSPGFNLLKFDRVVSENKLLNFVEYAV